MSASSSLIKSTAPTGRLQQSSSKRFRRALPRGNAQQQVGVQHRSLCAQTPTLGRKRLALRVRAIVDDEDSGRGEPAESLFMKELKRRGISSSEEAGKGPQTSTSTESKAAGPRPSRGPPRSAQSSIPPQLAQSRSLSSEGIEGLIPRATQLVKLGGTFFLAFLPLIITVGVVFGGITLVWGDKFVHGGRPGHRLPEYIDPYELLAEPTVDPMIPLR